MEKARTRTAETIRDRSIQRRRSGTMEPEVIAASSVKDRNSSLILSAAFALISDAAGRGPRSPHSDCSSSAASSERRGACTSSAGLPSSTFLPPSFLTLSRSLPMIPFIPRPITGNIADAAKARQLSEPSSIPIDNGCRYRYYSILDW